MASPDKNLGEKVKIEEKSSSQELKPVKNESLMLKSPALLAVKLEEQAILSATSDSETEDDGFRTKNKNQRKQNQKKQQMQKDKPSNDQNSAAQDETEEPPYEPPNQELQQRLIQQLEFYFSDENILKDTFLLKHIQKDKNGFVSLKLLASFRKMQRVTKNWRDLVFALEHEKSEKLQLNEKRNKVKRTQPLPEWDKTVHDRTVVVFNFESIINKNQSPIEAITAHFLSNFDPNKAINSENCPKNEENASKIDEKSSKNAENLAKNEENDDQKLPKNQESDIQRYSDGCEISLVRLIKPGKKVPKDIQGFLTKNHPEMAQKPCALVEFRTVKMARDVLKKFSGRDDWRGMQVVPLTKETLKKPIITTTGPGGPDNILARSPSKNKGAINLHRALQERCSLNVQINIPGHESDGGGPGAGQFSPRYHGNGNNSNDKRKLCQTSSDTHSAPRRSPLLALNSPSASHKSIARARSNVSPEVRKKPMNAAEDSPLSCSPGSLGSGGSPWIRRKMLHAADSIGSSELCKNQICIIRQPQGPDGTKGFVTKRQEK